MKKITCCFLLACHAMFSTVSSLAAADLTPATSSAPAEYGELLSRYAEPNGVRYADWHANPEDLAKLKKVIDFYASTTPPVERDAALAWHLNAYNAWILNNILKKYPTEGPLAGETLFFHGNRIMISGKPISFDHLEQKIIRPTYQEPRIHFALNCASESCPPLMTRPFEAKTLDADLDKLTKDFINTNPQGTRADQSGVKISKIFEWYADDFGGKDQLIPYINRYREKPLPATAKPVFLEYSWKLNSAK